MARMPIGKKKRIVTIMVLYMNMMNHLLLMMMFISIALIIKTNGNKRVNTGVKGKRTANVDGGKKAASKRQWRSYEDQKLVECLLKICTDVRWKNEAGFKPGFLLQVEKMMSEKIPGCDLKANPHIDSRYRLLKRHYRAICKMLGSNESGFRWNDKEKYVDCDRDVFNDWVRSHPRAKGLRRKPFPHKEDFAIICGKNRATGEAAETLVDTCEEIEREGVNENTANVSGLNAISGSTSANAVVGGAAGVVGNGKADGGDRVVGDTDASTKTKMRSKADLIEQLVGNIDRLADLYQDTNSNIAIIAQCFKHESVAAERRDKVLEDIMKLEGLTVTQKTRAAEVIISNPNKIIVFFNLDSEYKAKYVASQLV